MVLSSIKSEVRITDQASVNEIVAKARSQLKDKASNSKLVNERVAAVVVLASGKSPEEISTLAVAHALEVSRIESKLPIGDDGQIYTMSVGARDLLIVGGDLNDTIRKTVGAQRLNLLMQDQEDRNNDIRSAALNPDIKIYKIEVIGELNNIQSLNESGNVAAIFLDTTNTIIKSFDVSKTQVGELKRNMPPAASRALEDGLPPGISKDRIIHNRNFPDPARIPAGLKR